MEITWDPEKERKNVSKHGLDYSIACRTEKSAGTPSLVLAVHSRSCSWFIPSRTLTMMKWCMSSACAKRRRAKGNAMKKKAAPDRNLTAAQLAQLKALDNRKIDTDDIPEAPAQNWATAQRGRFFRPRKEAISIRLDMDVLDWLRRRSPRYQTEINRILREKMEAEPQR